MISQLLQTIMMALSVASGTNATGNTFYDEKEKPITKRAIENIDIQLDNTNFVMDGYYDYTDTVTDYDYSLQKYRIQSQTVYTNNYFQITNTIYTIIRKARNSDYISGQIFSIYTLYNFYRSDIEVSMEISALINANTGTIYQNQISLDEADVANGVYNLTLNNSTYGIVDSYWDSTTKIYSYSAYTPSTPDQEFTLTTPNTIHLDSGTAKNICFRTILYKTTSNEGVYGLQPQELRITGNILVPDEDPYEVVDIPGLMFTVLTLPFSFISQAFDLTIFPGTPYEVNFTNLFMTLIAIFILLWIIKKVFK